jgi:hypothetical protein
VRGAVLEAGMTFPFLQREVRVLEDRPLPEETEYRISNKEPQNVEAG